MYEYEMPITALTIDTCLGHIRRELYKRWGVYQADSDISPLVWYINTGRASREFLKKLVNAKPFMIARKLHQGGSYEEAIDRICAYIGYDRYKA